MPLVSPVFVVGAARSGTTALATALHEGGGYSGFSEGHLLPLLGQLTDRVRTYYSNKNAPAHNDRCLLSRVSEDEVIAMLRGSFRDWCDRASGAKAWFDKTPDSAMIATCPEVLAVWPEAIILYAKRRPIDNIQSRLRKFKGLSFENACREWVRCARTWHAVRPRLGGRFLEIDQIELLQSPDVAAESIGNIVGLDSAAERQFAESLSGQRPERTSHAAWTPLSQTGWSSGQVALFQDICGKTMNAAGYAEEEYWASADAS